MRNMKLFLLYFLVLVLKWNTFCIADELPLGLISVAQLPSDDDYETEDITEPANEVINKIPVQEHTEVFTGRPSESPPTFGTLALNLANYGGSTEDIYKALTEYISTLSLTPKMTVTVQIIPPAGATEAFLQPILQDVKSIVPQLVTNAECSFQIGASKNSDGTLKTIHLTITTGPATSVANGRITSLVQIPESNILNPITVDLSSTTTDLNTEFTEVLKKALKEAKPLLDILQPVGIKLIITPPSSSNTDFEQTVVRKVTIILDGLISEDIRSLVEGKSINNSDGTLNSIEIVIILQPKSINQSASFTKTVDIDLSSSGQNPTRNLNDQLTVMINTLKPQISRNELIQLILTIIPPKGSFQQYVSTLMTSLRTILGQLLPSSEEYSIDFSTQVNNDESIKKIRVVIFIQHKINKTQTNSEDITIDLSKPNVDIPAAIKTVLSTVLRNPSVVEENKNNPLQINVKIILPTEATNSLLNSIEKTVKSVLATLIPDREITVKSKTEGNGESLDSFELTILIQPSSSGKLVFNIDLTEPGRSLVQEVTKLLPNIGNTVMEAKAKNEAVNFTLNIQPPKGSTDLLIKTMMDDVLRTVSKNLPTNKIGIRSAATKNGEGNVLSVQLTISIEPSAPLSENGFNIDLTKSENTLIEELQKILPKLEEAVKQKHLQNGRASIDINIQPPEGSTEEFVKSTMNTILGEVSKVFPNNEIGIQAKTTKDTKGNVLNVSITIRIEKEIRILEPQNGNNVRIDLSKPGNDLMEELKKIIPNLKILAQQARPNNGTVNFILNIVPPKESTDQFTSNTLNTVLTTLSKIFPNYKLGIQAKTTKTSQGYVLNVQLTINIETSTTVIKSNDEPIQIDLTKPGSSLIEEILTILPNLKKIVKEDQARNETINFYLKIKPPEGSTEVFIKSAMSTVLATLSKHFPNNKLSVHAKSVKNNNGEVLNMDFIINIEPNINTEQTNQINVDLTLPGITLTQKLNEIIPNIEKVVQENIGENKTLQFNLNIQPPEGSTEKFVKNAINTVLTTLSNHFPEKHLEIQDRMTKDSQGNVINFNLTINLKPSLSQPSNHEAFNIDLSKPESTSSDTLEKVIPQLEKLIEINKPKDKTVSIILNIQPPNKSTENFVKTTINDILLGLSKHFPNNQLSIKAKTTKDSEGYILNLSLTINVEPVVGPKIPNKLEVVNIDLTKAGSNIVQEINNIMPYFQKIMAKAENKTGPASFDLNVTPPKRETDEYVKNVIDDVRNIFSNTFAEYKIGIKARTTKDKEDNILNISLIVTVEPNEETTESGKQQIIHFDLSKTESNLDTELGNILPYFKETVKKDQSKNITSSFYLKIKLPKGSTKEKVHTIINYIVTILTKDLRDNKLEVQPRTTKDDEGNVTSVNLTINIQPGKIIPKPKSEEDFDLDLTKPESSMVEIITNILPKLKDEVKKAEPKNKSSCFNFNIHPPKEATDQFVKDIMNIVSTTFAEHFPNNKLSVKAKTTKDEYGNIFNVSLTITVEPRQIKSKPNNQKVIKVDLSKSGSDLNQKITSILPNLKEIIENNMSKDESANFKLNIQPPEGASEEFVKKTMNTILVNLSKIFPSRKIEMKAKTTKDSQGTIINVNLLLTVQPDTISKHLINREIVKLDLSKPGDNLIEVITNVLPHISKMVDQNEQNNKPLHFNLKIHPPVGAADAFVRNTRRTVLNILSHKFSHDEINVEAIPTKNNKGDITDVTLIVNVKPKTSTNTEKTLPNIKTKPIESKIANVNMEKPGADLDQEITNILPHLQKTVEEKEEKDEPVNFSLNITSPKGATNEFVENTKNNLLGKLTRSFPNDEVVVKPRLEIDTEGNITNVQYVVTLVSKKTLSTTQRPKSQLINIPDNEFPFIQALVMETTTQIAEEIRQSSEEILSETTSTTTLSSESLSEALKFGTSISPEKSWDRSALPSYPSSTSESNIFISETTISSEKPFEKLMFETTPVPNEVILTTTSSAEKTIRELSSVTTPSPVESLVDLISKTTSLPDRIVKELTATTTDLPEESLKKLTSTPATGEAMKEFTIGSTSSPNEILSELNLGTPSFKDEILNEQASETTTKEMSKETLEEQTSKTNLLPKEVIKELSSGTTSSSNIIPEEFVSMTNRSPKEITKNLAARTTESPESISEEIKQVSTKSGKRGLEEPTSMTTPTPKEVNELTTRIPKTAKNNSKKHAMESSISLNENSNEIISTGTPFFEKISKESMFRTTSTSKETTMESTPRTTISSKEVSTFTVSPTEKDHNIPSSETTPLLTTNSEELTSPETSTTEAISEELNTPSSERLFEKTTATFTTTTTSQENILEELVSETTPSSNENLETLTSTLPSSTPVFSKKLKAFSSSEEFFNELTTSSPKTENSSPKEDVLNEVAISSLNKIVKTPTSNEGILQEHLTPSLQNIIKELISGTTPSTKQISDEHTLQNIPLGEHIYNELETPSSENILGFITTPRVALSTAKVSDEFISGTNRNLKGILNELLNQLPEEVRNKLKPSTTPSTKIIPKGPSSLTTLKKIPKSLKKILKDLEFIPTPSPPELIIVATSKTTLTKVDSESKASSESKESSESKSSSNDFYEELTPLVIEQPQNNLDVIRQKPGNFIIFEFIKELEDMEPNIKTDLQNGHQVTLILNIEPPSGATEQFSRITTESLVPILERFFPNNIINLKINAVKNPRGFMVHFTLNITIQPSQIRPRKGNKIEIDLSDSGISLIGQLSEALPDTIANIRNDLNRGQPVILEFNIRPPIGSTEKYLKVLAESLIPILIQYFPRNEVNVKTSSIKNPEGYITSITLSITIDPMRRTQPQPHYIHLNRYPSLITSLNEFIPNKIATNQGKPLILKFDLRPPQINRSLKITKESLIPVLSEHFPNHQIREIPFRKNPFTFNFGLTPAGEVTQSFIRSRIISLIPLLNKLFPGNNFRVGLHPYENRKGFLDDINLGIAVEPTPRLRYR